MWLVGKIVPSKGGLSEQIPFPLSGVLDRCRVVLVQFHEGGQKSDGDDDGDGGDVGGGDDLVQFQDCGGDDDDIGVVLVQFQEYYDNNDYGIY